MLTFEEQNELMEISYNWCNKFMSQVAVYGYRAEHTTLVLKYCKML